jgi:hypothetical protein
MLIVALNFVIIFFWDIYLLIGTCARNCKNRKRRKELICRICRIPLYTLCKYRKEAIISEYIAFLRGARVRTSRLLRRTYERMSHTRSLGKVVSMAVSRVNYIEAAFPKKLGNTSLIAKKVSNWSKKTGWKMSLRCTPGYLCLVDNVSKVKPAPWDLWMNFR